MKQTIVGETRHFTQIYSISCLGNTTFLGNISQLHDKTLILFSSLYIHSKLILLTGLHAYQTDLVNWFNAVT